MILLGKSLGHTSLVCFYDFVGFIYNPGQKSWDKFALLALLGTRQTRLQVHLPNLGLAPLPPLPPYNGENYYLQFLMIFNIVFGGGGGGRGEEKRVFKRKASLLSNLSSKTQIIR